MADISDNPWSWSATAVSNAPAGATNISTGLDDNLRSLQAGVRALVSQLSSVSGTNTITGNAAVAPTGYVTGMRFKFIPANTNTGATTINVNSLGAKSIFQSGAALVGGELRQNIPVDIEYDGTQFHIIGPFSGGNLPGLPAFLAASAGVTDVTGDSTSYTVAWGTEIYDQGGNFASNTFTAPVAGKYHFDVSIFLGQVATSHAHLEGYIETTARNYYFHYEDLNAGIYNGAVAMVGGCDANMAAGDTAVVKIMASGGSKAIDVSSNSRFSGHLVA